MIMGMKRYILVHLQTGELTGRSRRPVVIKESFRGRLENITRLVNEGKLIVAGPLGKNDKTLSVFIFIMAIFQRSMEAKELLQSRSCYKKAGLPGYGAA